MAITRISNSRFEKFVCVTNALHCTSRCWITVLPNTPSWYLFCLSQWGEMSWVNILSHLSATVVIRTTIEPHNESTPVWQLRHFRFEHFQRRGLYVYQFWWPWENRWGINSCYRLPFSTPLGKHPNSYIIITKCIMTGAIKWRSPIVL